VKTTYWHSPPCKDAPVDTSAFDVLEIKRDGLIVLGAPVGPPSFCREATADRIKKVSNVLTNLSTLDDPQIQYALLRSCFGFPKFTYVLQMCNPSLLSHQYATFDEDQCEALSDCVGSPNAIDDLKWLHASLPVYMGGLGIRSAVAHSSAAFVASTLQTESMVARIVGPLKS
jgi:hypothetical protein